MTTLDPKHLDAVVERQRQIAILHRGIIDSHKDTIRGPLSLSEADHRELIADATRAADTITALRAQLDQTQQDLTAEEMRGNAERQELRAQIDRERAATIEAAAKVADSAGMSLKPAAGWAERDVVWWETGGLDHILAATDAIRALHTDATRAAMDAIRREGYEAGAGEERAKSADLANAARDLADCCQLGEDADWEEGEDPLSALRAVLADITPPKTDRSEITP